jgi:hypothetical protein
MKKSDSDRKIPTLHHYSRSFKPNTLHDLHFFRKILIIIGVTGGGSPSTK